MTPTRETFERNLTNLQDDILLLGSMVEEAILRAIDALKRRDLAASEQIYRDDLKINEKRYAIENNCLTLIATQQPMARDLRLLAAILEINTELERMGDYAKGISRINMLLGAEPISMPVSDLDEMAQLGLNMLRRALSAFVARDAEMARRIPTEDDQIDALYNHIYNELMQRIIQDPAKLERLNYLVWAAHNLERMADRVTNICERIVFVTTGEMRELDRTDDEWAKHKTIS
jgi:phosphate transport system protein